VGKNVDEAGCLSHPLCFIIGAFLIHTHVRVVLFGHDRVVYGVLVGISVKPSVTAPRTVVTVNDLLRR